MNKFSLFLSIGIFILRAFNVHSRIITTLEEIRLETDPKYVVSNASIEYLGKSHEKYIIALDHNILQDIPNYWVRFLCFFLKFILENFEFSVKLQMFSQNDRQK